MKNTIWNVLLVGTVLLAAAGNAEIYKYIDENGQQRWTDDLSQVPRTQRPALQRFIETGTGNAGDKSPVLQQQPISQRASESTAAAESQETVNLSREALLKEKAALHEQYRRLMIERQQIQQALAEFSGTGDRTTIHRQAQAYNQKADAYDDRLDAFNQKVDAYKQAITALQVQAAE